MAYTRSFTVDSSPGGDTVKAAVATKLDGDLTNAFTYLNAHDIATTSVHGFTGVKTGSGAMVGANTPTLITPVLGVATATSINKVAITTPATAATLTISDGKTFSCTGTLTLAGTDGSTLNIGTGGTLGTAAYTAATAYEASGAVSSHAALLTGVHGLAITAGQTLTVTTGGTLGTAAYTAATAYDAAGTAAGKIASSISDGDTTHAPDGNSVFDALALKAPLLSPSFTTPVLGTPASGNLANCTGYPGGVTYASAAEINTGTEAAKAIAPDQLLAANIRLPIGWLSGLGITNTGADADHDLTIAAGKARDATDAKDMILASAITKQGDVEWAVGTNQGGFAAGEALPSAGTVHVWLIKRSDTGVVDVMFNDQATSGLTPTLPANYDYKRRIFSLRTVVTTGHFINGDQWGTGLIRTWMYDTPILDVSNGTPGTGANTGTFSTPGGIIIGALINIFTQTLGVYLSSLANTDLAPNAAASPGYTYGNSSASNYGSGPFKVYTNTSSQARYRSTANSGVNLCTIGYEDSL